MMTIVVAYTTALRTSVEASRTTFIGSIGLPAARLRRSRRVMFSTSMMASSTTSPSAITSPAMTIVFSVRPSAEMTTTAATSDSGMAVKLMNAVRQSKRNSTRIAATRPQPISSAWLRFAMERSMKVAGRKIVGSTSRPVSPGFNASSAASTRRVTSSVLPSGCFSTISNSPGTSLMMASPMAGGEPISTSATSMTRIGAPPRKSTIVRFKSSIVRTPARCRTARREFGVSTKPPDSRPTASCVALNTASGVTPAARRRSGSISTWNCLSR